MSEDGDGEEETPDLTTAIERVGEEVDAAERHLTVLDHVVDDGPVGIVELSNRTGHPNHQLRYSLRVLEEEGLVEPTSGGAVPTDDARTAIPRTDEGLADLAERVASMRREFVAGDDGAAGAEDGEGGLRCSLLGHDFGDPETEREREERGDEVVTTTREVERCRRCGERRIVAENAEAEPIEDPGPGSEAAPSAESAATDDSTADASTMDDSTAGGGERVERGDAVRLAYTARTVDDGTLVDTTDPEVAAAAGVDADGEFGPRTAVVGAGDVFDPVDEALVGARVGEAGSVVVPAAEAFGEYDDDAVRTVDAGTIDEEDRYPGAQVTVDGERGRVETVIGGRARVDFNHPLAGEDVEYEYEVVGVEDGGAATDDDTAATAGTPDAGEKVAGSAPAGSDDDTATIDDGTTTDDVAATDEGSADSEAVLYEFRGESATELVEGRRYRGTVEDVREFGAFVSLAPGATGLVTDAAVDGGVASLAPGEEVVVRADRVDDDGTVDFGWVDRQDPDGYRERRVQGDDDGAEGAPVEDGDSGGETAEKEEEADELLGPPAPDAIPTGPALSVDPSAVRREESLGVGGNADVSLATVETEAGPREIAFKEPRIDHTIGREVVDSLLAEARRWSKLDDHDNVVDVVDWGAEPAPWIAMEYMDGGDLGERAGELPFAQACWTAAQIAEGVYHAHRHGVAHLDLKPANVLFRRVEGGWDAPKVADWGLSRELLENSASADGLSVAYAAPEQIDSEAFGAPDDVTDVYGLGAVLYELFTGRPPFEGTTYEVLDAVRTETPPAPSSVADVPSAVDDVLLTALATDREDRYDAALYLRDEFRRLADEG